MKPRCRPGLLVSVRSAVEAAAALAGGADIIDVKEPAHGSLGRADDEIVSEVLSVVAGRRPVSAALGELSEGLPPHRDECLAFVKWGLAGCARHASNGENSSWQNTLETELAARVNPRTVIVAYADWQCAQAPPLDDVVEFACRKPGNVLLIDTHCKEPTARHKSRPTLLDWLPAHEIIALCKQCRAEDVWIALAGSLSTVEINELRSAEPDWFAVRGAACEGGDRHGRVTAGKVRQLVDYL